MWHSDCYIYCQHWKNNPVYSITIHKEENDMLRKRKIALLATGLAFMAGSATAGDLVAPN